MKRQFIIFALVLCALVSCKDHSGLYGLLTDYDYRIAQLEKLCAQLNTNINSLQTIINAQQTGDYITSITTINENGVEIGYTITFANHEPITIYHGKNGKDGQDGQNGTNGTNGTNGQDGHTPIIGVAQDIDGVYYWTLDGSWLLDGNGQKIRVTGQDGQNGQNGTNGTNGQDGITPQLKIEADYWYISYDNGATWTQLGKAKGEDGAAGTNGQDGQDGDSMFQSVTQDDEYIYFTLINGNVLIVAKIPALPEGGIPIVNGAIQAAFSVSPTKKVYFSQGNLQYQASTGTWRFALRQYDCAGESNANISSTYNGWIDLFGWGTSGWSGGNIAYQPYSVSMTESDYYPGGNYSNNLTGIYARADWGVYNSISNGGNQAGQWRVLTKAEWEYIINGRTDAQNRRAQAIVNYVPGLILLPDNWDNPWGLYTELNENKFNSNIYDTYHWALLEKSGAIFLPACGGRGGSDGLYNDYQGFYWSSTYMNQENVWCLLFGKVDAIAKMNTNSRQNGRSVRLVKEVE